MVCPGCSYQIDPIKVFERSPKTGGEWTITRCPRERCGFNIDLEPYVITRRAQDDDKRRYFWKDVFGERFHRPNYGTLGSGDPNGNV